MNDAIESTLLNKAFLDLAELRHYYRLHGRWNAEMETIYDNAGALLDIINQRAEVLYERRQVA